MYIYERERERETCQRAHIRIPLVKKRNTRDSTSDVAPPITNNTRKNTTDTHLSPCVVVVMVEGGSRSVRPSKQKALPNQNKASQLWLCVSKSYEVERYSCYSLLHSSLVLRACGHTAAWYCALELPQLVDTQNRRWHLTFRVLQHCWRVLGFRV